MGEHETCSKCERTEQQWNMWAMKEWQIIDKEVARAEALQSHNFNQKMKVLSIAVELRLKDPKEKRSVVDIHKELLKTTSIADG